MPQLKNPEAETVLVDFDVSTWSPEDRAYVEDYAAHHDLSFADAVAAMIRMAKAIDDKQDKPVQ